MSGMSGTILIVEDDRTFAPQSFGICGVTISPLLKPPIWSRHSRTLSSTLSILSFWISVWERERFSTRRRRPRANREAVDMPYSI